LRREQAEIEKVNLQIRLAFENSSCELGHAERLRHLAGAAVLGARRAVDQQDAGTRRRILLLIFRRDDRFVRGAPLVG